MASGWSAGRLVGRFVLGTVRGGEGSLTLKQTFLKCLQISAEKRTHVMLPSHVCTPGRPVDL